MKLMQKNKVYFLISALSLLSLLVILYFYNTLPDMIPTHWDLKGNINGYTSKKNLTFIPIGAFILNLFIIFTIKEDPKNIEKNKLIPIFIWITPIISNVLVISSVLIAIGHNLNIIMIVKVLIGFLFIITGNYMPKIKQNYTIGIRTPWTLNDEDNWNKTHRLGGKLFVLSGMLCFLSIYNNLNYIIYISFFLIMVAPIYSFYLYKNKSL